jgi:hypothetical protein
MPVRYSAERHVASLQGAEPPPVDGRRSGNVIAGIVAGALLALSITFFVTGAQHNATISDVEAHGVRVAVTVTACTGQLGGSGSNAAGYSCRGGFTVDGKRYTATLADNVAHGAGSRVVEVTSSQDPGHLVTVSAWRTDRASWRVFILPAVLALAGLMVTAALVGSIRRRRRVAD